MKKMFTMSHVLIARLTLIGLSLVGVIASPARPDASSCWHCTSWSGGIACESSEPQGGSTPSGSGSGCIFIENQYNGWDCYVNEDPCEYSD